MSDEVTMSTTAGIGQRPYFFWDYEIIVLRRIV